MVSRINLLAIFISLQALSLSGQITLEEYRQEVVNFSRELKIYDERVASSQSSYKLAKCATLPSISVDGSFLQLLGSSFGAKSWDFNLTPQVVQSLYSGGGLRASIKRAATEIDIEMCDALFTLQEVEYSADYAYWNLRAMEEYRDVANDYYETIHSLEEVVNLRYQEGYVPKGDLLMMQTRLSEAIYSKTASQQSYTIALQNFNTLRGYSDLETPVQLLPFNDKQSTMPSRVSQSELLNQRNDYTASLLSEEYSRQGIALSKSSYNPSLSVGVQGVWQPYAPNITGSTLFSGVVFVDLSIPIFNFGARGKAVDIAKRSYNQSLLTTESLAQTITSDEASAWSTLNSQYAQMNYSSESLSIAAENLEISTYSYTEGLTTIVDVMSAQVSWLQLYSNAIASEFSYMVAISDYRRVTGTTSPY